MIPDESAEVEMIETREMVRVDIFVESDPRGVVLTISADDAAEDVAILMPHDLARRTGDLLFRMGCETP